MSTWTQLIDAALERVGEPEAVFHTERDMQRYLEHGELLISVARTLVERTVPLVLTSGQADYAIHTLVPDFIWPLRVTINDVPLLETSFASLTRTQPTWPTATAAVSTPEAFGMIGATILIFNPPPVLGTTATVGMTAQLTYLRQPPTSWTTAAIGVTPLIADNYQNDLNDYAQAIALAKEGQIAQATAKLKAFTQSMTDSRDPRFLRGAGQHPADQATVPTKTEFED